jgi:hypothetical protein
MCHAVLYISFLLMQEMKDQCDQKRYKLYMSWKQPLAEMQRKAAYIRHKVVGPFPRPCVSRSYVHWAALFIILYGSLHS